MENKDMMEAVASAEWGLVEQEGGGSFYVEGTQGNGCPIVIKEQAGSLWFEITIWDEELQDGREIEYEIRKV